MRDLSIPVRDSQSGDCFLVPPAFVVALGLAQNAVTRQRWLNLKQIALYRSHAVIKFLCQMIELHELLRQVAAYG